MAKSGPKEKYAAWMPDCIREVAATRGQYQSAMFLELGRRLYGRDKPISPDTFAKWRKRHPEFEEAWKDSQIISQALDEKMLYGLATGDIKGNSKAVEMLFTAKYRHEYKKDSDNNGTTINNILSLDSLSTEELRYRIARSQEVLSKSGVIIDSKPLLIENE